MGKTEVEPRIYGLQKYNYAGKTDGYQVETDKYIIPLSSGNGKGYRAGRAICFSQKHYSLPSALADGYIKWNK